MIGQLISLYRAVNKISTREFADKIGVSPATVNRLELGKDCDMATMLKLIHWLFSTAPIPAQPELVK